MTMVLLEGQMDLIQYLPPEGEYETLTGEDHYKEKCKEWGLSAAKKEFWYKDKHTQVPVTIKGYQTYGKGDVHNTIVIEFPNGKLSCIHPAYLKEMQQASFGKESLIQVVEHVENEPAGDVAPTEAATEVAVDNADPLTEEFKDELNQERVTEPKKDKPEAKKAKTAKPKKEKIELPADKVHFTGVVKQFALTYNHFNEENDEVVVLENVQIVQEPAISLGLAWCSHSKTLKKFELAPGDTLEFDGKVAAKKLPKGKEVPKEFEIEEAVLYKINNPSKIIKNGL